MAAMTELFSYFAKLVEEKRKKPGRRPDHALRAASRSTASRCPPMDVLTFCLIIVIAGNETTRNGTTRRHARASSSTRTSCASSSATRRCSSPRSRRSCAGPARSSTSRAPRREDFPLRGKVIRKGDALALFYPSANRDEEIFPDAVTSSGSTATRTTTSASASASTSASARTWRGSSWRSPTSTCCRASRRSSSPGPIERLHSALVGGVKHLPIRYKLKPA